MSLSSPSFTRTSLTPAWPPEVDHPWMSMRLDWLQHAAKLPGRTLHVGLAVWARAASTMCPHVLLSSEAWQLYGLSRDCVYDALTRLSAAGLVVVDRGRGRHPVVSLLDRHGQYLAPRLLPRQAREIAAVPG